MYMFSVKILLDITKDENDSFINGTTVEICEVIPMYKDDCFFFPIRFSAEESPQLPG